MWHASLSRRDVFGTPMRVTAWNMQERGQAIALAEALLRRVGDPGYERWGEYVYHARRPLTDRELATLDPAWLALPAVDPADPEDD